MKRGLVILLLVFSLLVSTSSVFASAPVGCVDSDNGADIFTRGTVRNDSVFLHTDLCYNARTIQEYYCNGTASVVAKISCPGGCYAGACVVKKDTPTPSEAIPSGTVTCVDSDNGANYMQRGTLTNGTTVQTDYCDNSGMLTEWSCSGSSSGEHYDCNKLGNGYTCNDGACGMKQNTDSGAAGGTMPTASEADFFTTFMCRILHPFSGANRNACLASS